MMTGTPFTPHPQGGTPSPPSMLEGTRSLGDTLQQEGMPNQGATQQQGGMPSQGATQQQGGTPSQE